MFMPGADRLEEIGWSEHWELAPDMHLNGYKHLRCLMSVSCFSLRNLHCLEFMRINNKPLVVYFLRDDYVKQSTFFPDLYTYFF